MKGYIGQYPARNKYKVKSLMKGLQTISRVRIKY